MGITTVFIIIAIFFVSSVFHGMTGIGVTLIATTALASFLPMREVLMLTVLPCLFVNLVVFLDGGKVGYYFKKYGLLALLSFIGSWFGAKLVYIILSDVLILALGILIVGYVAMQFIAMRTGRNFTLPNNQPTLIVVGLLAGILGGATNTMSPLLVMYLLSATSHLADPKMEMIKSSNLCYVVGKIAQIFVLAPAMLIKPTQDLLLYGAISIISVLTLSVGFYFRHKISVAVFKKMTLGILLVLGLKALWTVIV